MVLPESSSLPIKYHYGQIAVASCASVSMLASGTTLVWIAYKCFQEYQRKAYIQRNHRDVFRSNWTTTILIMNLLLSDLLQSIGFGFSFYWSKTGNIYTGALCDVQAILIQIGDVASGCWAFSITLYTYLKIMHHVSPRNYQWIAMLIIWPFTMALASIGYFIARYTANGPPFYGSAGGAWCWISVNYRDYRMWLHYYIIFFIAIGMLLLNTRMFWVMKRMRIMSRNVVQATRKLLWYPLIYTVLVTPLALQRLMGMFSEEFPFPYLIAAACIFTSAGTVNSIIYGVTRSLTFSSAVHANERGRHKMAMRITQFWE